MKRVVLVLLVFSVLLTSCATGSITRSVMENNVVESSSEPIEAVSSETPSEASGASAQNTMQSEEEAFAMFASLEQKAMPILYWYCAENVDVAEDLQLEAESASAPYYKVGRFATIAELKAATTEVFTEKFAQSTLYNDAFGDFPMFKEIDGALYRNAESGGFSWPSQPAGEYDVAYQDAEKMVMTAKSLLPNDEYSWDNFLLRKEQGAWKLDTYFEYNPYLSLPNRTAYQAEKELSNALSSWFCSDPWTDPNQLDPNALINFYLYTYLTDVGDYDYEKGYPVTAKELQDGLAVYLNGIKPETLTAVSKLDYANATYDKATDTFYFDITFDSVSFVVLSTKTNGSIETLEIMLIGKSGRAVAVAELDLEVSETGWKYVGARPGEPFPEE